MKDNLGIHVVASQQILLKCSQALRFFNGYDPVRTSRRIMGYDKVLNKELEIKMTVINSRCDSVSSHIVKAVAVVVGVENLLMKTIGLSAGD